MYTSLLALAATLAIPAAADGFDCHGPYFSFYNRAGDALSYQQLDPALFPGVKSPHLHTFDGGNGLAASMDVVTTQSTCTTARIKPDKSNYWRPTLMYKNDTGFYRVPDNGLKIYYKFGDAGNVRANVTEFPENFSMITGNPFLRHDDGNVGSWYGPKLQWTCHTGGGAAGMISDIGFPKGYTSCADGFAASLTFPSCWNGQPLNPSNPSAHMAYLKAGGGVGLDACPEGFQYARFPLIEIEFWYDVSSFDGQYSSDSIPWVLSHGDPTGYGFHADFRNDWRDGALAKAIAEEGYCNCGCGCGPDELKVCFGDENINENDDPEFASCSPLNVDFPFDDKSPLEKLPGCNPIQEGPADATVASGDGCDATPAPSSGKPSSTAPATSAQATSQTSSAGQSYGFSAIESEASSTEQLSSAAPSSTQATESSVTDAPISLSISLPGKAVVSTGSAPASSSAVKAVESSVKPTDSFTLAASSAATATPVSSAIAVPSGNDEVCLGPTTITITPTVTVTAGEEQCVPTVFTTVTNTATVTIVASAPKHKRHAHAHAHGHRH